MFFEFRPGKYPARDRRTIPPGGRGWSRQWSVPGCWAQSALESMPLGVYILYMYRLDVHTDTYIYIYIICIYIYTHIQVPMWCSRIGGCLSMYMCNLKLGSHTPVSILPCMKQLSRENMQFMLSDGFVVSGGFWGGRPSLLF